MGVQRHKRWNSRLLRLPSGGCVALARGHPQAGTQMKSGLRLCQRCQRWLRPCSGGDATLTSGRSWWGAVGTDVGTQWVVEHHKRLSAVVTKGSAWRYGQPTAVQETTTPKTRAQRDKAGRAPSKHISGASRFRELQAGLQRASQVIPAPPQRSDDVFGKRLTMPIWYIQPRAYLTLGIGEIPFFHYGIPIRRTANSPISGRHRGGGGRYWRMDRGRVEP